MATVNVTNLNLTKEFDFNWDKSRPNIYYAIGFIRSKPFTLVIGENEEFIQNYFNFRLRNYSILDIMKSEYSPVKILTFEEFEKIKPIIQFIVENELNSKFTTKKIGDKLWRIKKLYLKIYDSDLAKNVKYARIKKIITENIFKGNLLDNKIKIIRKLKKKPKKIEPTGIIVDWNKNEIVKIVAILEK